MNIKSVRFIPLALALLALIIYLYTAPTLMLWLDAARLTAAIATMGISNPPAPLFVLLGHLFSWLPLGSLIQRIQFLTALISVAALVLTYLNTRQVASKLSQTCPQLPGIFALLTLAFSYQFWSQAQNVETFTLVVLLELVMLYLALTTNRQNIGRNFSLIAFLFGLSMGTNPVIVSIVPALLLTLFFNRRSLKVTSFLRWSGLGLLGMMIVFAYLPIRATQHPFLNWSNPSSLLGLWSLLTGGGLNVYVPELHRINGFTGSPEVFARSVIRYFEMLWLTFTPVLLIPIVAGAVCLYRQQRRIFWILISVPLTNCFFGGLYYSGNQESWFLMSDAVLAILAGLSIGYLIRGGVAISSACGLVSKKKATVLQQMINNNPRSVWERWLPWTLLILTLVPLLYWWPTLNRRDQALTADYIQNLYRPIKQPAIIFGSADLFDSVSYYVHDASPAYSQVIPVTDNILYMLRWYRDNLQACCGLLMPDDRNLKYDNAEEYSWFVNDFITLNLPKYHIYLTIPSIRNNFLPRAELGASLKISEKYQLVPQGMLYEVVPKEASATPVPANFAYRFTDPRFPQVRPKMLERAYNDEMIGMVNEYALSLEGLGDYYLQSQRPEEALKYYQQAITFNPINAEIVSRLGNYYGMTDNPQKAVEYFKKADALEPTNLGYRFNLAVAYANLGQTELAKAELQRILNQANAGSMIGQQALILMQSLENQKVDKQDKKKL